MQRLGQMTSKASSISMASSPSSPGEKEGESRQEDLQQGLLFRPWGLLGGGAERAPGTCSLPRPAQSAKGAP